MAQIVKATAGAIGYVDLADAEAANLVFASIKNADGKFVKPTIDGAVAALAGAPVNADVTYSPLNPAGAAVYPITSPTYVLVRTTYANQQTLNNVKGFLTFLLTDGQSLAKGNSYAKLPEALRQKALDQLTMIKVG